VPVSALALVEGAEELAALEVADHARVEVRQLALPEIEILEVGPDALRGTLDRERHAQQRARDQTGVDLVREELPVQVQVALDAGRALVKREVPDVAAGGVQSNRVDRHGVLLSLSVRGAVTGRPPSPRASG